MRSDLKPIPKLTLLALTNLLDWHTWQGQTSYEILAAESGLSLASVKRGVTDITKRGFIYKKRTGDVNGYKRNYYTIDQGLLFAYMAKWNPKSKDEDINKVSNRHHATALVDTINGSNRHHATALVDTTNQPNTQPYFEANKIQPNNSVANDAQGASLEGVKKEVRRIPEGQFGAGAILIDGDDWEPERKTNSNQAWIDGGWTPPIREERMKDYK
tara:strand:+ start:571 stop:1215 length:645 start_codon:yes stop_codon:yes gene_type:complete